MPGVVIKICDGIGGMHGNVGGRIIGIIGIMGTMGIMRGWRHEIARGSACFCSETVQGCSAAVDNTRALISGAPTLS